MAVCFLYFMKWKLKFSAWLLLMAVFVSISCQKKLSCYDCDTNKPPVSNAGPDQKIMLPASSVNLDGSKSVDPDNNIASYAWRKISGSSSFDIANATAVQTEVKNLAQGEYQFELMVTDAGGLSAKDTVQVMVEIASANLPPVACAGADQSIILPLSSATLDASCSTDPDNNINSFSWSNISGPSTANIGNATLMVTKASGLIQGVYQFELKVTDAGGLFSKDTIKVTVNGATVANCGETNRPFVNANLVPSGKLSQPSSGMSVATAGNKIVFAGASLSGNPPGYGSSKVEIFDIVTQTWSTASLSVRRADVSTVAAGNKIFFAGGRLGDGGNDQHFSTVDIYDVSTDKWSVATLSQSRAYIASATVGDKVFFAGGEREWPHPVSDRVDIYDLGTSSWSTTTLSAPRSGITAVTANNSIYFAGGGNQLGGINNVESIVDIYDNGNGSWSTTTLNEPKTFFAGIYVRNKIYWAGGYSTAGAASCKVEIADPANRSSATAFLSQPVSYVNAEGQNAVVKDNKIIWFATLDPLTGNTTDRFNIYDITADRWLIGILPFKISGASVISVNNTIYVAGGSVNGKMTDEVWKLEF
jgi:hypothetical protein